MYLGEIFCKEERFEMPGPILVRLSSLTKMTPLKLSLLEILVSLETWELVLSTNWDVYLD